MTKWLRVAAAAAVCLLAAGDAWAQQTPVTASSVKMQGIPVPSGMVTLTPVDAAGHAIALKAGGGGLNGPQAFRCTLASGAITGSCTVPDACLASPAHFLYTIVVTDTSFGQPTSQQSFTLKQVPNVCGSSWALDQYAPPATTTNLQPVQSSFGTGSPSGSCNAPAIYTQTGTANAIWICNSGSWVASAGSSSGGLPSGTGIVKVTSSVGGTASSGDLQTAIGSGVYDASGAAAAAQAAAETYAANASNLSSGTLNHALLPALVSGDIPNNGADTSGNAATATALAGTPTPCAAGEFARGILASGDATGCTADVAGSSGQIQWNNAGALAGAAGGLTNGTRWAFGAGSAVDGGPTTTFDGTPLNPAAVLIASESNTSTTPVNGIYSHVTNTPTATPTTLPYALYGAVDFDGDNWNGFGGAAGLIFANYNGTGTGANALSDLIGAEIDANNFSSGEVLDARGLLSECNNLADGTIDTCIAWGSNIQNEGTGTITDAVAVDVPPPDNPSGGAITHMTALRIENLSGTGVGTTQAIDQQGASDENDFAGIINANGGVSGPATAPTGACSVKGWLLTQDGHAVFCDGSTYTNKL